MTPDHRSDAPTDAVPMVSGEGSTSAPTTSPTPVVLAAPSTSAWLVIARGLRPRASRGQVLAGVLCALLGFAVVAQVRQTRVEGLSNLRQSDLVRILDDSTQRYEQLQREASTLEQTRQQLLSGSDKQKAALEAATQRAATQGILSGRLPAHGTGIEITLVQQSGRIPAVDMLNVLEELRNAGAEAVQLGSLRLTANSYFTDDASGVVVDGVAVQAPYTWIAIGDPDTMAPALEIPGGAMATVRHDGGRDTITRKADVQVTAVKQISAPKYATPLTGAGS